MKELNYKQDRNYFLMVLIMGMMLNMFVVSANGYMMPVKNNIIIDSDRHFFFQENNEVRFWQLSDIYGGVIKNYIFMFSIGDVIILIGIIGLFWYQIKLIILYAKRRKEIKKEKRKKFFDMFKRNKLEKNIRFNPI